jgi:hypothetical protein
MYANARSHLSTFLVAFSRNMLAMLDRIYSSLLNRRLRSSHAVAAAAAAQRATGDDARQLKAAGFGAQTMKQVGFTASELAAAGYKAPN